MKYSKACVFVVLILLLGCTSAGFDRNLGRAYLDTNDYDSAILEFKKSVNKEPNNDMSHFWLGKAYYDKGQYEDAIVHLKKATELQPSKAYNPLMLSNAYSENQQYQDAIAAIKKAIGIEATRSVFFKNLGFYYIKLQNYDEAITALKRAKELKPADDILYNNLGFAYGEKKQYDKAFKAFKESIEINPQYDLAYSNYGAFLEEKRDYTEAAEQYKKAVELKPNNMNYLLKLTTAYYLQGRYDDALETTNKAISLITLTGIGARIQIVEDYPAVYSLFDSGPADKADIKAGDRIVRIDGKSTKGWKVEDVVSKMRGQEGTKVAFSIKREDTKKTLEITVTREKIVPKEASTFFAGRSLIQRNMGKKGEARKDAKQAYSLNSSDSWAQLVLGAARLDQERYDEAVKLLSQVKESDFAPILEATAYARKGDFNKAVNIYLAIPEEKLSPKNVPLWSDRAALLHSLKPFVASKKKNAGKLKAQARHKEALRELGDAMKIVDDTELETICREIAGIIAMDPALSAIPEEARKYALRGDMLTEQGEFEDAVKEYRQAVQAAPYIAKLYFNTAMIYGELKKYFQATHYMKTYLQLAPQAPNVRAAKDQIYKWEFMMEKKK